MSDEKHPMAEPWGPDADEVETLRAEMAAARAEYEKHWTSLPDATLVNLMDAACSEAVYEHERFKARGGELDRLEATLAAERQEHGLLRVSYETRCAHLAQCEAAIAAERRAHEALALEALGALSAAGVATPVEGYVDAPHCLAGDIGRVVRDLAAERERVAGLTAALTTIERRLREDALPLLALAEKDGSREAAKAWKGGVYSSAVHAQVALTDAAPILAAHVEAATETLRGVVATVNRERDEAREEAHRNVENLRAERDALAAARAVTTRVGRRENHATWCDTFAPTRPGTCDCGHDQFSNLDAALAESTDLLAERDARVRREGQEDVLALIRKKRDDANANHATGTHDEVVRWNALVKELRALIDTKETT